MATRPLFYGPLLYFRTVPALETLSSSLLSTIAQHAEEVFFPSDTSLFPAGSPREAFFIIVEGRVRVRDPQGLEATLGPGDAVGLLHLLARSEEPLEARAEWDTVALRVEWDAHLDSCERNFPILEAHMGFLARRCLEERQRIREAGLSIPDDPPGPGKIQAPTGEAGEVPEGHLNLALRLQALHGCQAFPSASMDALAEMARHLEEVRHPPGHPIWAHGDPSGAFLMVASGSLALDGPGTSWTERLGPGMVAGQLEALAGVPRVGSLKAETPVIALRIHLDPLLDILEDHFTTALEFTAVLARQLIWLQEMGPPSPPSREIL